MTQTAAPVIGEVHHKPKEILAEILQETCPFPSALQLQGNVSHFTETRFNFSQQFVASPKPFLTHASMEEPCKRKTRTKLNAALRAQCHRGIHESSVRHTRPLIVASKEQRLHLHFALTVHRHLFRRILRIESTHWPFGASELTI
jgi:hypothetical protein